MRCPSCGADNPAEARKCGSCGGRFNRRPRRQESADESDSPFGKSDDPRDRAALTAYKCGVFSLIPLAGLVLGPAAVVLAARAWYEGRADPDARRRGRLCAAALLGAITFLFHGLGLFLMVKGLSGP